jgi:Leucine-rich repeat (LRR) protein
MDKQLKDMFLLNDEEIYAEAQRRIKECREGKKRKLDFSHLDIKELPSELAELDTLVELNLMNIDQKNLPDFLGNLTNLKILRIGSNSSSAREKEAYTLPETLANLTKLQTIYLGYDIPEIPVWLFSFKNLKTLTICNDKIDTIPSAIANLTKLEGLQIHGEKINKLPESLGLLSLLRGIIFGCPSLVQLPEALANLKNIEGICITNCNIPLIPDYFCDFTKLVELTISMRSTFQGPVTPNLTLPKNIGKLKNLKSLSIEYSGLKKIPVSIGNTPLEYLKIYGGDFTTLPASIGNISTLKTLEIAGHKLNRISLGSLSSLENLSLFGKFKYIPDSIGNLLSLKTLYIEAEETFTKLTDSIGNCKNLKSLSIKSDKLTELPDSICKLKSLETLYLDTFFLRSLPLSIGKLSELKEVSIKSEALTVIPTSIGKLRKLKSLTLQGSKIKDVKPLLENFSYIKSLHINCGMEVHSQHGKNAHNGLWQKELAELHIVSYGARYKLLEKYSVKKLESIICDAPSFYHADNAEKELVKQLILVRRNKLNSKFEWSKENIKRLVTVSDTFLKRWEEGFKRAKSKINLLCENGENKADFYDNYNVEIQLSPSILLPDKETGEFEYPYSGVYSVLMDYQRPELELTITINNDEYNLETKDDSGFKKGIHLNHDLSWNIEGFGDIDLANHYICYAMHILYSHHDWANEDIMKINQIDVEVTIADKHDSPVF